MNRITLAGAVLVVAFAQGAFGWQYRRSLNNTGPVKRDDVCDKIEQCHDSRYGDYVAILDQFRIGEIYSNVEKWCPQKETCWDNSCHDFYLLIEVTLDRAGVNWICNNKEGFKDTTCYQPPFTQTLQACLSIFEEDSTDYTDKADRFENCVLSSLDNLPGCSRDNAFAEFFKFVFGAQRQAYGY